MIEVRKGDTTVKKILRKMASSLLILLPLFGCKTEELKCPGSQGQPDAWIRLINFDGKLVHTDSDWPVAFDSYDIEDDWLVINGRFMIPESIDEYFEYDSIEDLETTFDESENVSIDSHDPTPGLSDDHYQSSKYHWDLLSIDGNNCCSFILYVDVSPIAEHGKTLGNLYLYDPFMVICCFEGAPIC